ncbi:MAG: hypothetical protein PHW20_05580 [Clostridia bacterium]|jgi:glucan phosphoethanolaminetransferase (alkaline phosphatase superfamily)|nr:hypothetical protein [Clostridia bacterium]
MTIKKRKNSTIVAIVISAAALLLSIANLILCYIYDLEKPLATIIVISIALVFSLNVAYYVSLKKKMKKDLERKDDKDK